LTAQIETARLVLRPFTADIIDALLAGDRQQLEEFAGARFPEPLRPPPLMEDALPIMREWLIANSDNAPWLVIDREHGLAVGTSGLAPAPASGEVLTMGYAVYPEFEGRGYTTEASGALLEWAFTRPEVHVVEATIPPWNVASIRVAEKLGMHQAGVGYDDEVGEVLIYRVERTA
jgi:RimJ/RimL family protein N-acetyltransferase